MVVTKDTWIPSEEELTVQDVPLGTPYLRAGAFHLGKSCEAENNEFMLCRHETKDPRACIDEGKQVTSCAMNFFQKVKNTCASEFTTYAMCLEKSSADFAYSRCRQTQAAYDSCMEKHNGYIRPHYGYFCLTKVHDSKRPKPQEERPKWMDDPRGVKPLDIPEDLDMKQPHRARKLYT